jgi:hypothetical protein
MVMKGPIVLLVTRRAHLTDSLKSYSIAIAGRLGLRILVAYVDTMPLLYDGGKRHRSFTETAGKDLEILKQRAESEGICADAVHESGKISKVVSRLCRILNNIKFIIVDSGVKPERVVQRATVPVFIVSANQLKRQNKLSGEPVSDRPYALSCKLSLPPGE